MCCVEGCSFRSATQQNLRLHTQAKHEKRQLACSYDGCAFRTVWPASMKDHVDSVHEDVVLYVCHVCGRRWHRKARFRRHQLTHAKQGHPVAECASCQEDLMKGCNSLSLADQEEQPSSSSEVINDLLTTVHLDLQLLSSRDN